MDHFEASEDTQDGINAFNEKINKTRKKVLCLLLFIIILISLPFVITLVDITYLPYQSKTLSFSNPQNFYPYIIADKKYKDVEVKIIDRNGKEFKLDEQKSLEQSDFDGNNSQTPYLWFGHDNINSNVDKFQVVIKNKSTHLRIINYGVWSHIEVFSDNFIKRVYF